MSEEIHSLDEIQVAAAIAHTHTLYRLGNDGYAVYPPGRYPPFGLGLVYVGKLGDLAKRVNRHGLQFLLDAYPDMPAWAISQITRIATVREVSVQQAAQAAQDE